MKFLRLSLLLSLVSIPALTAAPVIEKSSKTGAALHLRLHEGLSEKEIPVSAGSDSHSEEGITTRWEILERGEHIRLCQFVITNESKEERRLEPSLRWEFSSKIPFVTYWDGSTQERALATLDEPIMQSNIRRLAPWSAVYNDENVLLVGVAPLELRSYLRAEYQPGEETRAIVCATRLVLAPGQSDTVTFIFSEFPIRFGGQRETVQHLHDAFPEVYDPHPDVNPAVNGASAQYWASRVTADKIPGGTPEEFMRRMHATWDWCYTPFKRTGDHWGREEDWDYTPNIPFAELRATIINQNFTFDEMPRERFMQLREEYFNQWKDFQGLMFYSPAGVWVEEQLAREKYADAIIEDPNFAWRRTRWVTGWDKEVKVLPWFTSYEQTLKEDFAKIASEYNVGGVALDVARGGPKYRGPSIEKPLVIRAYDEEGIYIDQGVGVAKFIDYLHTLRLRNAPDKRFAVVGNPETGGQTFTVTARYDAGMFEGPPYHPDSENIPLARYILGRKPMAWWAGWAYQRHAIPNWRQYEQADFIKTMKGLTDYVIFSSYEYGGIPTLPMEFGVPKLMDAIPGIVETIQRGWQAVIPVTHDFEKELHVARYGTGLSSRLFFGNPYDQPEPITFRVDRDYLGRPIYVWAARHEEAPLTANVEKEETVISTHLPSRNPALFDTIAELPEEFLGTVTTSFSHSALQQKLRLKIQGTSDSKGQVSIRFPVFENFLPPQITVNGKPVQTEMDKDRVIATISNGEEMVVQWNADWVGERIEKLAEWNFFDKEGNPVFDVVYSEEKMNEKMQRRLSDYFLFCGRVVLDQKNVNPVKFVSAEQADAERPQLLLEKVNEGGNDITVVSPQQIRIRYGNEQAGDQLLDHFFKQLDQRYPYTPGFLGTWGIGHDMLLHYDMLNGVIK